MHIKPIKTRVFLPPKDDLFSLIKESVDYIKENSVLVITSKIVSIWQGRCIEMSKVKDKDELIKEEADFYLERKEVPNEYVMLTKKQGLLIPTAGIDESNGNGYYILWPKNPYKIAKEIYDFLKEEYKVKDFGIIISDSHCLPSRRGTMGVTLSFYGFNPLRDYRGGQDIFKKEMNMTQANVADALAVSAVCVMGEGKEMTPMALVSDLTFVDFKNPQKYAYGLLEMEEEDDIYYPLINSVPWKTKH